MTPQARLATLLPPASFPHLQVVSGAVQCLCALAGLRPQIAGKEVCRLAAKCYTLLDRDLVAGTTGTSNTRGIYGK